MRQCTPSRLAALIAAATLGLAARDAIPDTIRLKNGYSIDGKIDAEKSTEKEIYLAIGDAGGIRIPRDRIAAEEKNPRTGVPAAEESGTPAPAVRRDLVMVEIKEKAGLAVSGASPGYTSLIGVIDGSSDAATLVLSLPGAGTIRLPRDTVARIDPYRPIGSGSEALPAAAGERQIRTSHLVQLKNGRRLAGNILPGAETAPLIIDIGSLGRLTIDRAQVERIDAIQGVITLPPEEEATPTPAAAATEPEGVPAPASARTEPVRIDPELEREILDYVFELTRQRNQNRVRAEDNLRRIGAPAIPYLEEVAHDPFELTRRAALRVIRDVGSWDGMAMAIDALLDQDEFVRVHANEALIRITQRDLGFNPYGPARERIEAQQRWAEYYREHLAGRLPE